MQRSAFCRSLGESFHPRPEEPVAAAIEDAVAGVCGCFETKICKKICVGRPSPRSTKCTPLHRSRGIRSRGIRSLSSIFCLKIAKMYAYFEKIGTFECDELEKPTFSRKKMSCFAKFAELILSKFR